MLQQLVRRVQRVRRVLLRPPNRKKLPRFFVRWSNGELQIKKHSTIGSAVPFLSLLDILKGWLQLPHPNWDIYLNEQKVEPYNIILDYQFQGIPSVELRAHVK